MQKKAFIVPYLALLSMILFSGNVLATEIPYDGLTLKYDYYTSYYFPEYPSLNFNDNLQYIYQFRKVDDNIYAVEELTTNERAEVDKNTRRITKGEYINSYTTAWINPDVSVGDKIKFSESTATVISTSATTYISGIGTVDSIEVTFNGNIGYEFSEAGYDVYNIAGSEKLYYHKGTGILLRESGDASADLYEQSSDIETYFTYDFSSNIKDNKDDSDNDGLTDLEELLLHNTDPTVADQDNDGLNDKEEIELGTSVSEADTDGDYWNDDIDPVPTSQLSPNIFIILGALLLGGGGFYYFRKGKKKGRK